MIVTLSRLFAVATTLALFLGLALLLLKGGGTTVGVHNIGLPFAIPFAFSGVLLILRQKAARRSASVTLTASALGLLLPLYLVGTGTLVEYENWIQASEIASKYPLRWLSLYAAIAVLSIWLVAKRSGSRAAAN